MNLHNRKKITDKEIRQLAIGYIVFSIFLILLAGNKVSHNGFQGNEFPYPQVSIAIIFFILGLLCFS